MTTRKTRLQRREGGARRRHGEARQNQSEHGDRQDHGQERVRPVNVVRLLVVTQPAEQETVAHETVQHDHHDGEHGVASQRRLPVARVHDRRDHHHLHAAHGQRQHQRTQRFAQPHGETFRVAHHGEGRKQNRGEEPAEHRRKPGRVVGARRASLHPTRETAPWWQRSPTTATRGARTHGGFEALAASSCRQRPRHVGAVSGAARRRRRRTPCASPAGPACS